METVCTACGNQVAPGDQFCRGCGKAVSATLAATPTAGIPAAIPVPQTIGPVETSGKAITSLICGLLFFVPFAFIAAVVFGHIALSEIKRSAGRLKGEGLAIAIPNLLRARIVANEASALAGVRTLIAAEISYTAEHPEAGFTCSLSDLSRSQLISGQLAAGQRNGYRFELQGCAAAIGPGQKFEVMAYPLVKNQTGVRTFCADESGVIKAMDAARSADACLENGSLLQ
jgi:type IV pilus assembly protein PilA